VTSTNRFEFNQTDSRFQIRNVFNHDTIAYIATQIHTVYPEFDRHGFIDNCLANLNELTFSQRNHLIYINLVQYLPDDFPTSVDILVRSLGDPIKTEELEGYNGFYVMPFTHYVSQQGMSHVELSLMALLEMTMRFTAEWAIRPFLEKHESKTLAFLLSLASHPHPHARRLVSEGSRPRLPWGFRLKNFVKDPTIVFTLLERLKNEPTRLVQRSIANSLNDIAKDHPDRVIAFLTQWKSQGVLDIDWIISHATRSLVKSAHPATLALLGYNMNTALDVQITLTQKSIVLGETLEFSLTLHSHEDQQLLIDYCLGYQKANGTIAPKVFKLTTKKLKKGETITLTKRHPIKPATTRVHYSGEHTVQLQINGNQVGNLLSFELIL
jgi:3-methyladenine DNA glycosylase AlkC